MNDTKGEDNVENNNDEASTEGAEEEKVTDAPKTGEEAAPKGEVQNNEAAGNEQYPKLLDVPTECVESVEEGKVGSIGDDPKTSEEAALKGEVQNNCQETAPKPSEAAGNEQYPKSLDVLTECVESVEEGKVGSIGDDPKTSEEAALKGEVQNNCQETAPKPSEAAGNEQYPKSLDVPTECVESVEEGKVGSIGDDPKTGEEAALKGEVQNNCQGTAPKPSEAAGNEQYPKSSDVLTESVEKDKVVSAGVAPNTSQVNVSDVPTKPDLSETSVAEVPTNSSDTHTMTEPTDKATAHEEYEAAFRPQSRK